MGRGLSAIRVSKDEQRQSCPRPLTILKLPGECLHSSIECGAHDLQGVRAVDIMMFTVAEWEHSSSLLCFLLVCAPRAKGRRLPCPTFPKVCEDCESDPLNVRRYRKS